MPGKKEDKTTFVSEQWGLQLADLEFTGDLFMKGRFYEKENHHPARAQPMPGTFRQQATAACSHIMKETPSPSLAMAR